MPKPCQNRAEISPWNPAETFSDDTAGNRSGSASIPCRKGTETTSVRRHDKRSGILSNPLPNTLPFGVMSRTLLPQFPMTTFLTVKAAATFSNRSPSSVRRIIYPILEDNRHPDRHHIEPDVATAKSLRVKGENFAWKISEQLLRRVMDEEGPRANAESKSAVKGAPDQSTAIIEILRKQLDIKDQQIAAQNDVIKGLSERVREGNILMGSLQQQLSLTDGSSRGNSDVVESDPSSVKPEQRSEPSPESDRKTHWLFRKIF